MTRRIFQFLFVLLVAGILARSTPTSTLTQAKPILQTYNLSVDLSPERATLIKTVLPKVQHVLSTTHFVPGKTFTFKRAFGDMASALNLLAHRVYFWDSNAIEQPLFEVIRFPPVKNDDLFGAYAVNTVSDKEEFTWYLNPHYTGIEPHILPTLTNNRLSLVINYSNQSQPIKQSIREQFKSLEAALKVKIGQKPIGVSVISIDDPLLAIGVNDTMPVPVASAWKSIGLMYFLEHTDPAVWSRLPIPYWKSIYINNVPEDYRDAWLKYDDLLAQVYRAIVFSSNEEAAEMLAYIYNTHLASNKASNPIIAFNDWWLTSVSPGTESGLFQWDYGVLQKPGFFDKRFNGRKLELNGKTLLASNMFTPRDLANAYLYLATKGKTLGYYNVALELLSIRSPIISKIESHLITTQEKMVRTAGKDGYFFADSSNNLGHGVNNDAGLITLPDGRQFIVSFMALDPDLTDVDVLAMTLRAIINSTPD